MFLAIALLGIFATALAEPEFLAEKSPLQALTDKNGLRTWYDFGSVARYQLSIWEAKRQSKRWFIIGHHAQSNWKETPSVPVHTYQDSSDGQDSLKPPTGFQQIWNCQGDTMLTKVSFWRMQCPSGYVSLGDAVYLRNDLKTAPKEMFEKYRCVKENLTEPCQGWGVKIWDNDGSVARRPASAWPSEAKPTGYSEFFFANPEHNKRPKFIPMCLKKTSYDEI